MEGLDVGLVVLDTGSREGAIDGLDVGCILLGLKEGTPDCAIDGCPVGITEGFAEGFMVGFTDASVDGLTDGL